VQHAPEAPSLTAINLHILKNLWLPDVEILDLKSFETHSVLSKLEGKGCIDGCDIWTFQFFWQSSLKRLSHEIEIGLMYHGWIGHIL
jgi:hypothetical protein